MCGICGQFNFNSSEPVQKNLLKKMTDLMISRGPDDEGYYLKDTIGLGFRRLSIIDLEGGHQPISDKEEQVWVVFNGEIYNFREVRKELEDLGYKFRTSSDTEVIVHGYKEWGKAVLDHLNGMFGLGIWDTREKELFLVRDRMGIKPLYYTITSDKIYFASEIKPLLIAQDHKPKINLKALYQFLRYRFTPSPLTIYDGIQKLAPGTSLSVSQNSQPVIERWWNFKPRRFDPLPSPEDAKEILAELYQKAIKRHLISDVPLGLLLSGGIDSTLLLALMKDSGNSWQTFTVGYGDSYSDDELSDAVRTTKKFGSHNEQIKIDQSIFESSLPKIINIMEEPIASSSVVPMYFLCEQTSKNVKVALMGQGPDELFGGYTRHLGLRYNNYWRALPSVARQGVKHALNLLPRNETVKRGLFSLDAEDRMQRYSQVFSLADSQNISNLFNDGILPDSINGEIPSAWSDLEPLMEGVDEMGGLQFLEVRSTLPDELLMYADKISMAHSLEVRVPYLDHEIVEFIEQLPASYKIRNGSRKWLHRKVAEKYVPSHVMNAKKRGFAVNVVDNWFKSSMTGKINDLLLDPKSLMYEYLDSSEISKLVKEHKSGKNDNHKILFSSVVFEEWLRNLSL